MSDENPLNDLYMDRHDVDQQALRDVLSGLIGIDSESGDPIYLDAYFELGNKQRFVAQLLFREASVILGEREESEQGAASGAFAEHLDSSGSAVQNYSGDLEFVESDESRGGYVIRPHHVQAAVSYLKDAREQVQSDA
ncbi:hypothetical protein SAMN04487950_2862 [Halogranum rubrum]|uniref:Uncharacterized protein n=1 Tax=Halogranum rubrum TaxID=553466 RepID=A0A1I4FVD0_9EURY|nr:hypothetical protein [Halogranum rubrum]SFL21828.1 hypothetical protein SAMN04487950_2862 [Halogranum rubrum]